MLIRKDLCDQIRGEAGLEGWPQASADHRGLDRIDREDRRATMATDPLGDGALACPGQPRDDDQRWQRTITLLE